MSGLGKLAGGSSAGTSKPRALKWEWLDDLDASGLPAPQRDALRRIGSHSKDDGTGSHPSYEQIGEELGGRSVRAVARALRGDPARGWARVVDIWCEVVNGVNRPRGHALEYRLRDADERAATASRPPDANRADHRTQESRPPDANRADHRTQESRPPDAMRPPCDPFTSDPRDCDPSTVTQRPNVARYVDMTRDLREQARVADEDGAHVRADDLRRQIERIEEKLGMPSFD